MKEFNLEEAKAGKPVCTRDGRPARIICWDRSGRYRIVALIKNMDMEESLCCYDENGINWSSEEKSLLNLMMAPEKKEGWVNLLRLQGGMILPSHLYNSREEAINGRDTRFEYIATIKIEWEE